jgi:hypothetical protein
MTARPPQAGEQPRIGRRAVLAGIGCLVAAGATGGALLVVRDHGGPTPTAVPTSAPTIPPPSTPRAAATAGAATPPATRIVSTATADLAGGVATATPAAARSPAPASAALPLLWADAAGRIRLRYPDGWTTKPPNHNYNLVEIDDPAGQRFFADAATPAATLDDAIQQDRQAHASDPSYTFTDGIVMNARVGGEPAKTMSFSYVAKGVAGAPQALGAEWIVDHGGATFRLYVTNAHADLSQIEAIIASVTFPA